MSMKKLARDCYRKGYEIYGKDFFERIRPRLDDELHHIEAIPGGAEAFLSVSEYLTKTKNLYHAMRNRELWYTFRGPVSSGLVSYFMGITNCDPVKHHFYSWAFFMKQNHIDFHVNMSMDACNILSDQEMYLPPQLTLYEDRDLTDLDAYVGASSLVHPVEHRHTYDRVIYRYFHCGEGGDGKSLFTRIHLFDEREVPEGKEILAFLKGRNLLPQNMLQLMKLNGFLHSSLRETDHFKVIKSLAKDGEQMYEHLISCPEDVYEELVKNGCDPLTAERIAKRIQRDRQHLITEDLLVLVEFCGEDLFEQSQNIDHLFYRSHIFEKSCLIAALMEVRLEQNVHTN